MPSLWPIVQHLTNAPIEINDDDMAELERFIALLHKRTSPLSKVNEAHKHILFIGNWKTENIPPAHVRHVK